MVEILHEGEVRVKKNGIRVGGEDVVEDYEGEVLNEDEKRRRKKTGRERSVS